MRWTRARRQWRGSGGSGHGSDWQLCAGSQDSGGTGGSTCSGHGRGAAAAALTDGARRKAGTQGRNAGHWRGLTARAAQRKCERCGMKRSGVSFYKTVWQLNGFRKPKSCRNKFRYYCEIHAYTNFHPAEKHKI